MCPGWPVKPATAAVIVLIVIAVSLGFGSTLLPRMQTGNPNTSSSQGVTTLGDILAGKFPSATDKQGSGGVTVTVRGLLVLYVRDESDGDWHVAVTDGKVNVFITEIIPSYQQVLGRPVPGSVIDETGAVYCDVAHETESWHGGTCWEIHPVTAWQASSGNLGITSTTYPGSNLNVTFSYAQDPIVRGSEQTISVGVSDSDGRVSGVVVYIEVDYASGATTRDFQCTTTTEGACAVTWQIGGNSDPGTFGVRASVDGVYFYSGFEVTA